MPSTDMVASLKALKLFGMAGSYDETLNAAIRDRKTMTQFLASLCQTEAEDRRVRSIRYQMGIAGFPVSKAIDTFMFADTPINEQQARSLYHGSFLNDCRNIVLVGGTGTGKSHLAIAMAANAIRSGKRGRFYSVVDLVNRLEQEHRNGETGKLARQLARLDFVVLDELGYLPFSQAGAARLFHLVSGCYEVTSLIITTNLSFGEWSQVFGGGEPEIIDRIVEKRSIPFVQVSGYRNTMPENAFEHIGLQHDAVTFRVDGADHIEPALAVLKRKSDSALILTATDQRADAWVKALQQAGKRAVNISSKSSESPCISVSTISGYLAALAGEPHAWDYLKLDPGMLMIDQCDLIPFTDLRTAARSVRPAFHMAFMQKTPSDVSEMQALCHEMEPYLFGRPKAAREFSWYSPL